jgi:hypothetical protein
MIGVAPTVIRYYDYPMQMIGHDDHPIQFDPRKMNRQVVPFLFNRLSHIIQNDIVVLNIPKRTFLLVGTHGNKIIPRPGIIIIGQANGMTVMDLRIKGHFFFLSYFLSVRRGAVVAPIDAAGIVLFFGRDYPALT